MLLRQLPTEGRLVRKMHGEAFAWDAATHLLATLVDLGAGANWQRGGGHGPRPQPIQRPGQAAERDERRLGTPIPIDEARRILDDWGGG